MDTLECPLNGKNYVVREARRSTSIVCTREHHKNAIVGDESFCIIALGAKDKVWVTDAYIGSGNNAYLFVDRENLVMMGSNDRDLPPDYPGYVFHYIVGTKAAKLRDLFDQHKEVKPQSVWLYAPSPTQTRVARKEVDRLRRLQIKAIKERENQTSTTVTMAKETTIHKAIQPERTREAEKPPVSLPAKRQTRQQRLNIPRRHVAPILYDQ